jgi:cysteine synthase A
MARNRMTDADCRPTGSSIHAASDAIHSPGHLRPSQTEAALTLESFKAGVGCTPVIRIGVGVDGRTRSIFVKLESLNPCGSLKDRTALGLVESVGVSRLYHEQLSVVESTSGNLGIALATIANLSGFPFTAVVDPKTPRLAVEEMRSCGASIEMVMEPDSAGSFLQARMRRAADLCAQSRHRIWLNQYSNLANPRAHYLTTAPEIDAQMEGAIDTLFVPVSTGGTLAGVARYFRAKRPRTRIVAVDALGSTVFGAPAAPRRLTGIGASQMSHFIRPWHFDEVAYVSDAEAFAFCRAFAADTGISLGGSSGAVLTACCRDLARHAEVQRPVCLAPDGGDRYICTIYDDEWVGPADMTAAPRLLDLSGRGTPVRFSLTGDVRRAP